MRKQGQSFDRESKLEAVRLAANGGLFNSRAF
jgi:hypothetical protein